MAPYCAPTGGRTTGIEGVGGGSDASLREHGGHATGDKFAPCYSAGM